MSAGYNCMPSGKQSPRDVEQSDTDNDLVVQTSLDETERWQTRGEQ